MTMIKIFFNNEEQMALDTVLQSTPDNSDQEEVMIKILQKIREARNR